MKKDEVLPKGKWEFDKDVAECFNDMLSRSIPNYDTMRDLVFRIGRNFCKAGGTILDIGCSDGEAIRPFVKTYGDDCGYILCDASEPMVKKAKEKFGSNGECFQILNADVTTDFPKCKTDLVLSILTMQFIPIEHRAKVMQSIYQSLNDGGALILVEKVLGAYSQTDDLFVREYYSIKHENLYTQEQIQAKRKSLEGVLVPVQSNWNVDMMKKAGFRIVDQFWGYLNFAGWVAVK